MDDSRDGPCQTEVFGNQPIFIQAIQVTGLWLGGQLDATLGRR